MIETLSGTSAGSPTELMTMNFPRRSIFASMEIFIGGSNGTSPSPCHSPISGWNCFIVGLLSLLHLSDSARECSKRQRVAPNGSAVATPKAADGGITERFHGG